MLKLGDLATDGGGGNMKPIGRGADRARVRGGAKIAEGREIHRSDPRVLHFQQHNGAEIDMASTPVWVKSSGLRSQVLVPSFRLKASPRAPESAMPYIHML